MNGSLLDLSDFEVTSQSSGSYVLLLATNVFLSFIDYFPGVASEFPKSSSSSELKIFFPFPFLFSFPWYILFFRKLLKHSHCWLECICRHRTYVIKVLLCSFLVLTLWSRSKTNYLAFLSLFPLFSRQRLCIFPYFFKLTTESRLAPRSNT